MLWTARLRNTTISDEGSSSQNLAMLTLCNIQQAKIDSESNIKINVKLDTKIQLHGFWTEKNATMCWMLKFKKLHVHNHAVQGE